MEVQDSLLPVLLKIKKEGEGAYFLQVYKACLNFLKEKYGIQAACNITARLLNILGLKKPSLAIYDHCFHIIGGGQKYGFTVADSLKDLFDITFLVHKEVTFKNIFDWYGFDFSGCTIKVLNLPFFNSPKTELIDPGKVTGSIPNPFHAVSLESGRYDFFINNSMNEMVYPLANISYIICHFPERRPKSYFYADRYTGVIYNSKYTARWIEKKWKFSPHFHLYPPVDMEAGHNDKKENLIISVARFEQGGSKKQLEIVNAFLRMKKRYPRITGGWKLVLIGGSPDINPYLKRVQELLKTTSSTDIMLKVNIGVEELKEFYFKAKIFWHLCGLDQTDPALVEHFGMTIVEAMQNKIVPLVFDGGGQREIVDHLINGCRVNKTSELISFTVDLIKNPQQADKMAQSAYIKSKRFSVENFRQEVRDFFQQVILKYKSGGSENEI